MSQQKTTAYADLVGPDRIQKRAQVDTGQAFYIQVAEGPDEGKIYADMAKAVPRYLGELGVDLKQLDQYWLEVVRFLAGNDLKVKFGAPLRLVWLKREGFALADHKPGKGEAQARADAEGYYKTLMQKRSAAAI